MEQIQQRYQVILNNQLAKGFTLEKVLDNLSVLFKKDRERIREILSQPEFVVKSGISIEQAKKIQVKLTRAGISSRLYKIETAGVSMDSLPGEAQVSCPKCGLQQPNRAECQSCGIIFAKYGSTPAVYEPKKRIKEPVQAERSSDAWYSKGSTIFALLIIVLAAILLLSSYEPEKEIDPAKVGIIYYEIEEVRFIDDLAEPDYVTIVELFADWCKTCNQMLNHEQSYIMKVNPRMAIRRIDMSRPNGFIIASKHFNLNIRSVPYIIVFDEDGHIIADDGDGDNSGDDYVWNYKK